MSLVEPYELLLKISNESERKKSLELINLIRDCVKSNNDKSNFLIILETKDLNSYKSKQYTQFIDKLKFVLNDDGSKLILSLTTPDYIALSQNLLHAEDELKKLTLKEDGNENPPLPPPPSDDSPSFSLPQVSVVEKPENVEQSLKLILKLRNNSDISLSEYNMLKDIINKYTEMLVFNNIQYIQLQSILNPNNSTPSVNIPKPKVVEKPEVESPSKFLYKAGDSKPIKEDIESPPPAAKSFHSVQQLNPQAKMSKEEMDKARRERIERLDREAKERAQKAAQDKKISNLIDKYTEAYQIKK